MKTTNRKPQRKERCPACGATFRTALPVKIYCSPKCAVAAPKKRREETLLREYPAEARYREVLDLLIASAKEQRTEVFSRVSWGGVASIFGRRKLAWVSLHVYSGLALRLSTKKPNRWVAQTS